MCLTYLVLFIAFVYALIKKGIRCNKQYRWYIYYLGFIVIIEFMSNFSIYILDHTNIQYLYPFYVAGEFYIVVNLFLIELKKIKKWRVLIGFIALCFFIEAVTLWLNNEDASTGYGKILSHLTIICLIATIFIKNISEIKKVNLLSIIHASFFFYFTVSLFLFMAMNQLNDSNSLIWIANNTLSTLLYCSFIYTFYRVEKWSSKSNM